MSYFFLVLAIGVGLLVVCSDLLVKTAITLSKHFKISPLLTGITFVSIGTSLPELIVSVVAFLHHDQGLAVGNIVGSNISNILLILSLGFFFSPLRIGTQKTVISTLFLGLTTILFVLTLGRVPSPSLGIIFLFFAFLFTFWEYRKSAPKMVMKPNEQGGYIYTQFFKAILAVVGVGIGGMMTVSSVEQLSAQLGYSTTVLGLSLTALATSLPELLATIISQEKHQAKLALGNIIGSNIYNLLLIGGILALSSLPTLPVLEVVFLMISTLSLVFTVVAFKGKKVPIIIGMAQLCLYGAYLLLLSKHFV